VATTEPLTGNTVYQQTDAPLGGQQAGTVVTQMASLVVPRYATAAARDTAFEDWVVAGNSMRDGLQCWLTGTGRQEYTTSGGWVTVSDGKTPQRLTRAWKFLRSSGNNSDQFSPGSFVSLIAGTAAAAPAGAYLITATLSLSATASASGNLRVTAAGTNISADIKEDLTTSSRIAQFSTTYTHGGGDLLVTVFFQASQTATISNAGSQINVAYLGPQ